MVLVVDGSTLVRPQPPVTIGDEGSSCPASVSAGRTKPLRTACSPTEGDQETSPALRLQILTTEHWSLLSTRSLSWNEAFSRASMFLSVLSGAVVALALVAQATAFGEGFMTFALLILPVVLFVGVATFLRLVAINHEDVRWVVGMNLLRHAYLEAAPSFATTSSRGQTTMRRASWPPTERHLVPGSFAHEFVTTPGMLAVVDGVIAGILVAIVALQVGTVDGGRGRIGCRRIARDLRVARHLPVPRGGETARAAHGQISA